MTCRGADGGLLRHFGVRQASTALCLLALGALFAGCAQRDRSARNTLDLYLAAVHREDAPALAWLSASSTDATRSLDERAAVAAREEFARRLKDRFAAYQQSKVSGQLDLGPDGIGLIKGSGVGRGTSFQVKEVHRDERSALLRVSVVLGYNFVSFDDIPDGVHVYLMAQPVGRFLTLVRGQRRGEKLAVLGSFQFDCRLERADAPDHPTGWVVRSIEVVPGSEQGAEIVWK